MAHQNVHRSTTVRASADLSAVQFQAITILGALPTVARTAAGVLQNKPTSGQHANLAVAGELKIRFGSGGVNANSTGMPITIASGGLAVAAASGDVIYGRTKTRGISSGEIAVIIADFSAGGMSQS